MYIVLLFLFFFMTSQNCLVDQAIPDSFPHCSDAQLMCNEELFKINVVV